MKREKCVACGSVNVGHFIGRQMIVRCKHVEQIVTGLSGIECREADCGEVEFINGGSERYARATDEVVGKYRAIMTEKYRAAVSYLGLRHGDSIASELRAKLSTDDPVAVDMVIVLLELMTNEPRTLGHILQHSYWSNPAQ
ncbi:hypothetical protein YA0089_27330 [Pseudomonas viridiflava]|uniref:hypothetical protein n=1 Tax=Pseudomonas viridiflava TaxID=33069 RepID=UPI0018E5C3E9|nr:hypothetical protein [Pseudomonas viridiflava]MBI6727332.1 hypothetical protein [Pseudomonas viridiflava]